MVREGEDNVFIKNKKTMGFPAKYAQEESIKMDR